MIYISSTMALNKDQKETLRKMLLEQKAKLQSVLESLARGNPKQKTERVNDNADVGTEAMEDGESIENESLSRETWLLLQRTNQALEKIDEGTYGKTDEGQDIPYKRLLVDPTVTTLVQ